MENKNSLLFYKIKREIKIINNFIKFLK